MESNPLHNQSTPEDRESNLSFRKEYPREGVVKYVFDRVEVGFDTSGKKYKALPEIAFGTFDDVSTKSSLIQPKSRREAVDMSRVVECIRIAMQDSGYQEVWFYPYGEDTRDSVIKSNLKKDSRMTGEDMAKERSEARIRLFRRYGSIERESNGHGYIIKN